MDGFATSHMQSEALMPEPELLKEFLGDPESRIKAPTLAQGCCSVPKGRVHQLQQFLQRHQQDIRAADLDQLRRYLEERADQGERQQRRADRAYAAVAARRTSRTVAAAVAQRIRKAPVSLFRHWWMSTTRDLPAVFRTSRISRPARSIITPILPEMCRVSSPRRCREYGELTGRVYTPVMSYMADDAGMLSWPWVQW